MRHIAGFMRNFAFLECHTSRSNADISVNIAYKWTSYILKFKLIYSEYKDICLVAIALIFCTLCEIKEEYFFLGHPVECVLHQESCLHFFSSVPFQIRHFEFDEEWERREVPCLRSLRRVKVPFEIRHFWRQFFYWEKIGVRILCLLLLYMEWAHTHYSDLQARHFNIVYLY